MHTSSLSKTEAALLYVTFGLLIFGIVISNLDRFWFDLYYTVEDGFIEWMTVLSLALIFGVTARRFSRLLPFRNPLFLMCLLALMGGCIFAIGEELSWGQRLLHHRSSVFFKVYNSQKETNLHNLVVSGKSINLIVFSRLLILVMALYLLALPILYHRHTQVRQWVAHLAVPIPRTYQVVALFLVFGLISLCPSGKRAELLEFGTCCLLLSVVLFPANPEIFQHTTYGKSQVHKE